MCSTVNYKHIQGSWGKGIFKKQKEKDYIGSFGIIMFGYNNKGFFKTFHSSMNAFGQYRQKPGPFNLTPDLELLVCFSICLMPNRMKTS